MIVTCSNCEARYAVDPLAIGPGGRTVQCARCSHRWFQKVEGPRPPPDIVIRPPERGVSLPVPVPAKPEPIWGKRIAVAAGILILLGAAGVAGYLYRDQLIGYRDRLLALLPSDLQPSQQDPSSNPTGPTPPTSVATAPPSAPASPPAVEKSSAPAAPVTTGPRLDAPSKPAQLEVDLAASKIELVDGRYIVHGEIANHGGMPWKVYVMEGIAKVRFFRNDGELGKSYAEKGGKYQGQKGVTAARVK